jgi:prepilin-type N-terminal cleavage/methylation domain-containing protein
MRQILRMQQGTTLVELLVALALLGVVMAAAGSLYFGGFNLFVEGDNRTEIQDHARMGMDNMTRAIRGAGAMVELQENQVMFLDHSGKK